MRHLRTRALLAPVVILAAAALTACGSGSSSSSSAGPSDQLEVRPVYVRYAPGVDLGPQIPTALVQELSAQKCPIEPHVVHDRLLECDPGRTVFLLNAPIVTGGVEQATATHIGNQKLWYVKIALTKDAADKLAAATSSMDGHELAYTYRGQVVTSIIVDSSFDPSHLVILGSYDEAQAKKLADQLNAG